MRLDVGRVWSKSPKDHKCITANGEVRTKEEATVEESDSFVTLKLLDDTPAALSLAKLCEDTCRSLSQNYQPVHPARLQVHQQHRYSRTSWTLHYVQYKQSSIGSQFRESTKNKKTTNQDEDIDRAQGDLLRDLSDWLEEFTENLVDERVPSSRDTRKLFSQMTSRSCQRSGVGKHYFF